MGREAQCVCYLFVAQSFGDLHQHLFLSFREHVVCASLPVAFHCQRGHQNLLFYRAVGNEVLLRVVQVVHHSDESIGLLHVRCVGGVVLDDEVFQFGQFTRDRGLVSLLVARPFSAIFVLHVGAYLLHELVERLQNQYRYAAGCLRRIDGFYQRTPEAWQLKVHEIGVRVLQVGSQRLHIYFLNVHVRLLQLMVHHSEEGQTMHTVRRAHLFYRLFANAHRQTEPTDNHYRVVFLRHQLAHLMRLCV